jgi:hypothetical protein
VGAAYPLASHHRDHGWGWCLMVAKLSNLALAFILLASLINLVIRSWRLNTIALVIQYLSMFILIGNVWPSELAVIKLLIGWMVSAVLGITLLSQPPVTPPKEKGDIANQIFRALAGILVLVLVNFLTPGVKTALSDTVADSVIYGGLVLIGMGLLQLGMTSNPLHFMIGLLSFVSGFELLYAVVEVSTLLAGLLAGVNLGLVLVGAWLITKSDRDVSK